MAKKTIKIKDYSKINEEYIASAAITPGHLVELDTATKVKVHASAGETVLPMIALEDELQGKSITDAYSANTPVQVWIPNRGDIAYMLVKDGENISVGDFLESGANGTVQKYTAQVETSGADTFFPNNVVGVALEAVDMSGSSAEDPSGRIQVRII